MLVAQLQRESELGARETIVAGIDAQHTDPRTGGSVTGRNEAHDGIDEVGAYAQSETHFTPEWELVVAGRVDQNNRLPSAVVSPRAALIYKPNDSHTLRLSYNRAFETPTTDDLFLDIVAGTLSPAPFNVRALGVPSGGFAFRHNCGGPTGLCMRSPFSASPAAAGPADATLAWRGLVNALNVAGIADLRALPAPTSADIRTELRLLNVSDTQHPSFDAISAADVRDVEPLRETRVTNLEVGYKGILAEHWRVAADVYYERRNDFIAPPTTSTPNVFYAAGRVGEGGTLANYLGKYLPPDDAQRLATLIGGVSGSSTATGFPVGTVTPDNPLTDSPDVILTFRNFGTLHRWGSDAAAQWLPTNEWTITAAYSWTNKDVFSRADLGGLSDIALNAPRNRVSIGVQHRDDTRGLTLWTRGRFNDAFPMNSGVYVGAVQSATVVDAGLAYRVRGRRDLVLTAAAQNLLDERHREFVGGALLGRVLTLQAEYTFR
jgi:iron complex outermembrane receptor protein